MGPPQRYLAAQTVESVDSSVNLTADPVVTLALGKKVPKLPKNLNSAPQFLQHVTSSYTEDALFSKILEEPAHYAMFSVKTKYFTTIFLMVIKWFVFLE
jgi:hypothetical protein